LLALLPVNVAAQATLLATTARQLETGVQMVLEELKAHPTPAISVPPYPNYHKGDGLGNP
jgi:hypothetical protein